jgi:hypothetical protein
MGLSAVPTTQRGLVKRHVSSMRDFAYEVSDELGADHKFTKRIRQCASELEEVSDRIAQRKHKQENQDGQ